MSLGLDMEIDSDYDDVENEEDLTEACQELDSDDNDENSKEHIDSVDDIEVGEEELTEFCQELDMDNDDETDVKYIEETSMIVYSEVFRKRILSNTCLLDHVRNKMASELVFRQTSPRDSVTSKMLTRYIKDVSGGLACLIDRIQMLLLDLSAKWYRIEYKLARGLVFEISTSVLCQYMTWQQNGPSTQSDARLPQVDSSGMLEVSRQVMVLELTKNTAWKSIQQLEKRSSLDCQMGSSSQPSQQSGKGNIWYVCQEDESWRRLTQDQNRCKEEGYRSLGGCTTRSCQPKNGWIFLWTKVLGIVSNFDRKSQHKSFPNRFDRMLM
jgi:hypothetical protein